MSTMTLEQVRKEIADLADEHLAKGWLAAIDAHLTQPAQAVDVGAKVADAWRDAAAACLGKHSRLFRYVCEEADKLTAAHPQGCKHEWEQVTERGKFCVHCGQIITHATFEYVPPQEDTPDAAR